MKDISEFSERLRRLAQDADLETEVRRALQQKRSPLRNVAPTSNTVASADVRPGGGAVPPLNAGLQSPLTQGTIIFHRDLPTISRPSRQPQAVSGDKVTLEEAVQGQVVEVPGLGSAFVTTTPVGSGESSSAVVKTLAEAFKSEQSGLATRLAQRCKGQRFAIDDVVWFDLETTGLSSSPLFLIGAMVFEDGNLVVKQYFARHYGEEGAVVALFANLLNNRRLLVTFNGKSFDLPFVQTRAAANGVRCYVNHHHFDLLHESRRIWRTQLPNCKLQTLEQHLFGRTRVGDIPGRDIPDAYHNFVRTSDATQMVQVLQHNLQDLVTLAELMTNLPPA